MSPTEAQIRARRKYREKQEYIQVRVSPDEKAAVIAHIESTKESLSDFMRRAFTEAMERDRTSKTDP